MLWFEESDKQVWHLMTKREGPMNYHASCGWHLSPFTGRIWPQTSYEEGPPDAQRCRTCIGRR